MLFEGDRTVTGINTDINQVVIEDGELDPGALQRFASNEAIEDDRGILGIDIQRSGRFMFQYFKLYIRSGHAVEQAFKSGSQPQGIADFELQVGIPYDIDQGLHARCIVWIASCEIRQQASQ